MKGHKKMEVNFDEMQKQNKKEILKSNKYVKIEILIGKGNDLPYANCQVSKASDNEVAIAIKTMEEIKKALIQRNPLLLFALETIKVDETFIKDSRKEGFTKVRRKEKMKKIKYYLFCIKWLWKNRNWANTRQKWKRLEKNWSDYSRKENK